MYDPDYLSKSASKRKEARLYIIYFVVFAMSIIGAILMAKHDWKLISFKPDLSEDWNQIFLKYLFIIVAIERAAAVYVGIDRNQNKRKWKNRIKRVREILETNPTNLTVSKLYKTYLREKKIIASLEAQKETSGFLGVEDPDIPISTKVPADNERNRNELIAYLQTTKNVYEFKSEIYEEHTNTILARIVFIGGIIIAVVGLSIFNDIFEASNLEETYYQLFFYRLCDIVVTGGLLGGGSKGFNLFLDTLGKSLNRIKNPKTEE